MGMDFGVNALIGGIAGGFSANRQYSAANLSTRHARQFADMMSRTQYQRAVKDLSKAGLNPMLAYDNPAAVMSSPTTPGPDFSGAVKSLEGVSAGVADSLRFRQELRQLKADAVTSENMAVGSSFAAERAWQDVRESRSRTAANLSNSLLADAQRELSGAHRDVFTAQKGLIGVQTQHETAKDRALRLATPYSPEQESLIRSSPLGDVSRMIKNYLGKTSASAIELRDHMRERSRARGE